MGKFIGGKFRNLTNPKDGFAIADCEDSRAKRVLEFLISIFYLGKPTRVTVTVGNTIFGALLGERKVNSGVIVQPIVTKLMDGVRKLKAMPIRPYLFYLYIRQEVLHREEMVAYDIGLDLLKFDFTPEPELDQPTPSRSEPRPVHPSRRATQNPATGPDRRKAETSGERRRN